MIDTSMTVKEQRGNGSLDSKLISLCLYLFLWLKYVPARQYIDFVVYK